MVALGLGLATEGAQAVQSSGVEESRVEISVMAVKRNSDYSDVSVHTLSEWQGPGTGSWSGSLGEEIPQA